MPYYDTDPTYFDAILDGEAWLKLHYFFSDGEATKADIKNTICLFMFVCFSLACMLKHILPEELTPTKLKWMSGIGAGTFMACWLAFIFCTGDNIHTVFSIRVTLVCLPIFLIAHGMQYCGVQPHYSEPWRLHHVFYLFIGVQYLCIRHSQDEAPLGEVHNARFLACHIKMLLMTAYNALAATILADFVRTLLAKKFVIYDGENGEGRIIDPQPEEESVDVEDLVRDIQGLIEDIKTTKGDVQDDLDDLKEANDNLKDLKDYVMVFKPLAGES